MRLHSIQPRLHMYNKSVIPKHKNKLFSKLYNENHIQPYKYNNSDSKQVICN